MPALGHKLALWFGAAVLAASLLAMTAAMRAAALPPEATGKFHLVAQKRLAFCS